MHLVWVVAGHEVRLPAAATQALAQFLLLYPGPDVTDHAGDDQAGIVERGPEGVAERVPQLSAFVDRSRRRRRDVTGDPARKQELGEEVLEPSFILADVGIDLA